MLLGDESSTSSDFSTNSAPTNVTLNTMSMRKGTRRSKPVKGTGFQNKFKRSLAHCRKQTGINRYNVCSCLSSATKIIQHDQSSQAAGFSGSHSFNDHTDGKFSDAMDTSVKQQPENSVI